MVEYKKNRQRIERYFWHEKETLLDIENKVQQQNERLSLYHQTLMSAPTYFLLNQKEYFIAQKPHIFKDIKDNSWRIMAVNYSYDSTFEGNILIVGQIGWGKTTYKFSKK